MEEERVVKCVLVGDAMVGKTALAVAYSTNDFPDYYVPTAYDNYSVIVLVDKKPVRLQLSDTAGQNSFDSLRPLSYPDANVFLLVYSTVSPSSLQSIARNWLPEITKCSPDTPVIVVGTQADRQTWQADCVSVEEGKRVAAAAGADFFTCSALTKQNLKQVFDCAILAGLEGKTRFKSNPATRFKQRLHDRIASFTRKLM